MLGSSSASNPKASFIFHSLTPPTVVLKGQPPPLNLATFSETPAASRRVGEEEQFAARRTVQVDKLAAKAESKTGSEGNMEVDEKAAACRENTRHAAK